MKYLSFIIMLALICIDTAVFSQTVSATIQSLTTNTTPKTNVINPSQSVRECPKIIFSESPAQDTHTSLEEPSMNFGNDRYLRVRGLPKKKECKTIIQFRTDHLYANDIQRCLLKLYTVTKNEDLMLSLYGISDFSFMEDSLDWNRMPSSDMFIGSSKIIDNQFIEFDITAYIKNHIHDTTIAFVLESDGKKAVDIASKESGLTPELVLDVCLHDGVPIDQTSEGKYRLKVLPNEQNGKFTTELTGLPAGGFGNLMLMDARGVIVKNYPLAIREGNILYHALDLGDLRPGPYWAVFRKGRIMLRDEFLLGLGPDRIKCKVMDP
jgi:hypothetical protein